MNTVRTLMDLHGRVALITGGAGHLGRAMGDALAELGASIAVLDLDAAAASAVADDIHRRFGVATTGVGVDLTVDRDVRAVPDRIVQTLGGLDVVINNAALVGTSALKGWAVPFAEQDADTWRAALDVNLTAAFVLTQASLGALTASGHGSVINIGSIYGVVGPDLGLYEGTPLGNPAAYAASKGGLIQFSRWLSTSLAPAVRVNAITLGGLERGQAAAFQARYIARTPLKRMGREEDLKGAVAYLASDLSAYVTGHNLIVDGGWTAW